MQKQRVKPFYYDVSLNTFVLDVSSLDVGAHLKEMNPAILKTDQSCHRKCVYAETETPWKEIVAK